MKTTKRVTKKELEKEATKLLKNAKRFEEDYFLEQGSPLEKRQFLGQGKKKLISIRVPEDDLSEIQKIARINGRKYQQLIVQAIELYIDNYHRRDKRKKRFDGGY